MLAALAVATLAAAPPQVTITSFAPPTVHGSGFHRHEHVRVDLTAPGVDVRKRRRASARGTIVVRFPDVALDRCSGFAVSVTGTHHDRARVRRLPSPECAPL